MKCYFAYLSYKKIIKPITDSYLGNKKLLKGEEEREKELLNNIGLAIIEKIKQQYNKAKKTDKEIESNIDKKAEQVTKLMTSHIIRGNDIKLLAIPSTEGEEEKKADFEKNNRELRQISAQVRNALKELPQSDKKLLLDKYEILDNNNDES